MPARAAATIFSLMPPTGNTSPRRLISPVTAVSLRMVRSVISEASAMNIATPALRGPGQPGGNAGNARAHGHLALELRRPQDGGEIGDSDADWPALALRDAHRGVTQSLADLAFEVGPAPA